MSVGLVDKDGLWQQELDHWSDWGRLNVEPAVSALAACDPSPRPIEDVDFYFEVVDEQRVDLEPLYGTWVLQVSERYGEPARACIKAALSSLKFDLPPPVSFFHHQVVPRVGIMVVLRLP